VSVIVRNPIKSPGGKRFILSKDKKVTVTPQFQQFRNYYDRSMEEFKATSMGAVRTTVEQGTGVESPGIDTIQVWREPPGRG